MSTFGLDYSSARPSHAAMKTAGVKFVMRYIGSDDHTASRHPKFLTPAEAKSLHDDGFDVGVFFEKGAKRADGGRAAGLADAELAIAELKFCGLPVAMAVYFTVDYDAVVGPLISAYFQAAGEVLTVPRTGGYGGYRVVKALRDKGLIGRSCQTYAWSNGQWDSRNDLEQYSNNRTVGGSSVDFDRAMRADFGQWPAKPLPAPAPKPKPWPGRYLKYVKPIMHGSDVEWVQQRLNAYGAKPAVKADSEYGPKTRDAVERFQNKQRFGLAGVDGIVGPKTWGALAK